MIQLFNPLPLIPMDEKLASEVCPYWAPACEQTCTLTVGGLYVPLPEHTVSFCRTAKWDQCPQHISGCEALRDITWKRGLIQEEGRRRHQRFSGRYSLAVAATDHDVLDRAAWTIDLSLGGMRIETAADVPESGKISFFFSDSFWLPGFAGQAAVRWRRQLKGSGRYQCGLDFIDSGTGRALGETLGMT